MSRRISHRIPSLTGGVSQQPQQLRNDTQAQEQVNGLSLVTYGLSKRPPATLTGTLGFNQDSDGNFQVQTRDGLLDTTAIDLDSFVDFILTSEGYRMIHVHSGILRVFDMDGFQVISEYSDYLYAGDKSSREKIRLLNLEDETLLLNKEVTVQASDIKYSDSFWGKYALVWVKAGAYSSEYTITVKEEYDEDDATQPVPQGIKRARRFTVDTPDGTGSNDDEFIKTTAIAESLVQKLRGGGVTASRHGSVVQIRTDIPDDVEVDDTRGGDLMGLIPTQVNRFSELPPSAPSGFKVKIVPDAQDSDVGYYMEYKGNVWTEIPEPGTVIALDETTLPIIFAGDAIKTAPWKPKEAGEDSDDFNPSIIGKKLQDLTLFRGRLVLAAKDTLVMSRSEDFYHLYRKSAQVLLDSDPIDVTSSQDKAGLIQYLIPYNRELFLFGTREQFVLSADQILSPRSVAITPVAAFDMADSCPPLKKGGRMLYSSTSGVREYIIPGSQQAHDSALLNPQAPKYIPPYIYGLTMAESRDVLAVSTYGDKGSLYIYNHNSVGTESRQSAWSMWQIKGAWVVAAEFIGDVLYVVAQRSDRVDLLAIDIRHSQASNSFPINMDYRQYFTPEDVVFDPSTGNSTVTLKFPYVGSPHLVVSTGELQGLEFQEPKLRAHPTDTSGRTLVVANTDLSNSEGYVGVPYRFYYRFSQLMRRGQAGAETEGRLQLRSMTLDHAMTGHFTVFVEGVGQPARRYVYNGGERGSYSSAVDAPWYEPTGTFRFPVRGRSDRIAVSIVNDSWMPCNFTGAFWEGTQVRMTRRK